MENLTDQAGAQEPPQLLDADPMVAGRALIERIREVLDSKGDSSW